jgi:hypothetical protein
MLVDQTGEGAMKALTLWQPWASAILCGLKNYETRSWSTKHRGPLAIHASKGVPTQVARDPVYKNLYQEVMDKMGELFDFDGPSLPTSCIVTTCLVDDCISTNVTAACQPIYYAADLRWGNYSPNRFAWKLSGVFRGLEPVACSGTQGLWNVPEDVVIKIGRQIMDQLDRNAALKHGS